MHILLCNIHIVIFNFKYGGVMRRIEIAVSLMFVIAIATLCGCEEKTNTVSNLFDRIYFDGGGIFRLIDGNVTFITDRDGFVVAVKVRMLFQNVVDRTVSANVSITFYDENNVELYTGYREFYDYPPGYADQSLLPANTITYDGEDAYRVDHVSIAVREIS